jgi:L-asparaginase
MSAQSIRLLYVGGTIGMEEGASGYAPGKQLPDRALSWLGQHPRLSGHHYQVEVREPLIDSANATPADWLALARALWQQRESADGFVILHGTDTLAYTASALSFLMRGFGKPVVITGSQRASSAAHSDARANVIGSTLCALEAGIDEVTVYFGGSLMRGNRVRKLSSEAFDSFRSPHWPVLATVDAHSEQLRVGTAGAGVPASDQPSPLPSFDDISVGLLKLYPGISGAMIQAAAQAHPQGLVLELYGAGAGPAANRSVVDALRAVSARGTPLVGVSQCFDGEVNLNIYEAGRAMADCGVIDGADLTAEAALTKLFYLAGHGVAFADMAHAMRSPIAGEVGR